LVLGIGYLFMKMSAGPVSRRLAEIGNRLDRVIVRRVSRYGRHYQQWILDSRRFMEAKGLATVGNFTPELDEVFVDVSLASRPPHVVPGELLADVPVDVTQRRSIWEFLGQGKPVVLAVLGAPGSGKTTLLSHIARRVAQAPRGPERTFPILLQLRDHARQVAVDPKVTLPQLVRDAIPALPVSEPPGWWENQLHHGRCVVLLDGLDEVASSEERHQITAWISGLIAMYPHNDFVVTSRPHGYRTAEIESAEVLQVRPFTSKQVRKFLHGWYLAVERRATGSSGREVEILAEEGANDLLDRLAATPALHDLTINPLLLTMIANVHRYRGSLPGSRADLYGEVCQVMLWRRQEAKKLALELPGASKERLLARLAFKMMRERTRDLPRGKVLEIIRPWIRRMSTSITAGDFLLDVGSNGLLVERERNLYRFVHLTFQEYLAAKYIQDHSLGQILVDGVDDLWWREVTLLYVANADADPIVRAGLKVRTPNALSLAFACNEMSAELAPDLREHFNRVMRNAFEKNAEPEYRRLAAGTLASRHLRNLVSCSTGTFVCLRPMTANLYWLFMQDSRIPRPEGFGSPPDPDDTTPVSGMWGSDATAFVRWLNAIIGSGGALYRLPTSMELDELAEKTGSVTHAAVSMPTSAWTKAEGSKSPTLWTAPGEMSPRALDRAEVRAATVADVTRSQLLAQTMSLGIRTIGLALSQVSTPAVEHATALASALSAVNPFHDHSSTQELARSLIKHIGHARELAAALERALFKTTRLARDVAEELDRNLTHFADLDLIDQLAHASARERDFVIAMEWYQDMGLSRARDDAHVIHRSLSRARVRLAQLAHTDAYVSDLDRALVFDRELPTGVELNRTLSLLLRRVMGTAFATALTAVLEQDNDDHEAVRAARFADTLVAAARADRGEHTVDLDRLGSLAAEACATLRRQTTATSWASAVAGRLAEQAVSILAHRERPTPLQEMIIRLPALALAVEADRREMYDIGEAFRTIADGVTLLRIRADHLTELENLVLARA
jgi:pantothenate kinase-related protein Tda10